MRLQKEVFNFYKDHINAHFDENASGGIAMKDQIEHSALNYQGVLDKTAFIPKIFDEKSIADFEHIVSTTDAIFTKVIHEYQQNAEFRKLFPFPKEMEELILLPVQYDGALAVSRFDIFYNEEDGSFKFCEINTDGAAAMIRDLELRKALINNPAHQAAIREYELVPFELFDSWVQTFMKLYDTYPKKKQHPNIALVDFLENATLREFEEFARHFQDVGYNCEICDIRKLQYRDNVLYSAAGNPIDAVYRRAVTADIMDHYDEVSAFLDAARDGNVFFAGAFATQVIHSKWLFYVLHHKAVESFLNDGELAFIREHVPVTVEFSADHISLEEVQKNKDSYILKPMDAYASKGIYAAGREYDQPGWEQITAGLYGREGYICQEYCTQYMTENIDFAWGDGKWHPYINMPGLYNYNGHFAGILMRMACEEKIIVAHENERTAPVFTVKGRKDRLVN